MSTSSKSPPPPRPRIAGGAATGSGINYQAVVTAIAAIYMVRGRPLRWLGPLTDDTLIALEAETGGAGDDLRLHLAGGTVVEVQVKKGLRVGAKLWDPLIALGRAVTSDKARFGLLVVSPSSSATIREDLATDIARIGDGRSDGLSAKGTALVERLEAAGIDPSRACARIGIRTIAATTFDHADVQAARAELGHLCVGGDAIDAAWNALYADATRLIEHRGRRDVSTVLRVLAAERIELVAATSGEPVRLLSRIAKWTWSTNARFAIFGLPHALDIDKAWIDLTAVVRDPDEDQPVDLAQALAGYQNWETRAAKRDAQCVDPETLGRFVTRAILVAGPGMGKTTLLKRIARRYSEDCIPVLRVRLSAAAARMRTGVGFEEAVFALGLDGSGVPAVEARAAKFVNWLLLCDGLDECGSAQEDIAAGVMRFAAGHPQARVIVTTRPIGYDSSAFAEWRHYDLTALDPSAAHAHAARLLEAIAPPGSALHDNAWDLCRSQLQDTSAGKLVGRTPLLLGLAVAIIAQGHRLGATREMLFEQLFALVDDIPNVRAADRPATTATLRRFVDILAWHVADHPLSTIAATIAHCARILQDDLGTARLAALGQAERLLQYWEDVGLVERVGQGGARTIAFIHKSFGEYAASRYLRDLDGEAQVAAVARIAEEPNWVEVLRFAGMMGLADLVTERLLVDGPPADASKNIAFAVELVAEAEPAPSQDLRARTFSRAIDIVRSDRRVHAWKVGTPLVAAARRMPDEVGPRAHAFLADDQFWTRVIGWACVVAAGQSYYALDDLVAMVRTIPDELGPGFSMSSEFGFTFGPQGGRSLTETFVLDACAEIIDRAPAVVADEVAQAALAHRNLHSVDFVQRARELVREKGKAYVVDSTEWPTRGLFDVPPKYVEAQRLSYEAMFDALDLPPRGQAEAPDAPLPLLHFSAFLEASRCWHVAASDVWAWTRPYDRAATRAALQGAVASSGIDPAVLRREMLQVRRHLDQKPPTEELWLFRITAHVDPLPMDWARAVVLSLDRALIEKANFHSSTWIVWLAASLLDAALTSAGRPEAVRRLLAGGTGFALRTTCGLASELDRGAAVALILERLARPIVDGCEHLFDFLAEAPPLLDGGLLKALSAGLLGNEADTAVAAAKLASAVASPGDMMLARLLNDAFEHWQATETPSPTKSGVIPTSPRAQIVRAVRTIHPLSYEAIKALLRDPRSDVTEVAAELLLTHLREPEGERALFLADISGNRLPARFLGEALRAALPLDADEVRSVEALLGSENPGVRLNAMGILSENYLSRARLREHAVTLAGSAERRIRDRAYAILDDQ